MIKGIAFDLEGTVVDVDKAHHQAHLLVAKEAGVLLTFDEALVKLGHFIGGPDEKIMEEIAALAPAPVDIAEFLKKDKQYYEQFLQTIEIKPREGFLDFLKQAKQKGIPVAIGSLTARQYAQPLLDHSGLSALFPSEMIVLREHVKNMKPAPDVFIETAKRLGIDPKDQLVFEDSPRGVQAALAAGSKAIGVPGLDRPETIAALQKAGAIKVFVSWKEIHITDFLEL